DLVVGNELRPALVDDHLDKHYRQGHLAVIDMTNNADVYVRFGPIEFLFSHVSGTSRSRVVLRPNVFDYCSPPSHVGEGMEPMTRIELMTSSLPRTRSAN